MNPENPEQKRDARATGLTLERCHDVLRWLVPGAVGETHTGQGDCYKCQRVYDRITQTGEFAALSADPDAAKRDAVVVTPERLAAAMFNVEYPDYPRPSEKLAAAYKHRADKLFAALLAENGK